MPDKRPIIIQHGSFVCAIYDVENLMALPLAKIRKLWKIMFSAEHENMDTIQTVCDWLNVCIKECADRVPQAEEMLKAAKTTAAQKHSEHACMGDDYWSKRVAACKAALKKATAYVKWVRKFYNSVSAEDLHTAEVAALDNVANLTRALEIAKAQRDAPKLADRTVKDAQQALTAATAEYAKAQKLQAIFTDMSKN